MKRENFSGTKQARREDAVKRAAVRAARTPQEQLDILDKRLGVGVGAKKEREKLQAIIASQH